MKAAITLVLFFLVATFVGVLWSGDEPVAVLRPSHASGPNADQLSTAEAQTGAGQVTGRTPAEAVSTPARRVELVLLSLDSMGSGAQAVPDVQVTLGVGWPEEDDAGVRAADARGLTQDGPFADQRGIAFRTALAQATTDKLGRAEVSFDLPAGLAGAPLVWAEVTSSGRQRWIRQAALPQEGSSAELKLLVRDGFTLRGRVIDAQGRPVDRGEVSLFGPGEDGELDDLGREYVSRQGGFRFHSRGEGGMFHLVARTDGRGAGALRDVQVDPAQAPQDLVIQLMGDGELAGVVQDPTGRPVEGLRLWACPLAERETWVGYLSHGRRADNEWGGGLYDTYSTTDPEGRFRLSGLRQGEYVIRTPASGSEYYEQVLTETPVVTGTEDLVLRADSYRIRVRVSDWEGDLLPLLHNYTPRRYEDFDLSAQHGYGQAVYCHESDGEGHVLDPRRTCDGRRTRLSAGGLDIHVAPGASYLIGVLSAGAPLMEREVHVGPDDHLTLVDLRLGAAGEPARLAVQVQSPDGVPLESHTEVEVFAPESGKLLFWSGRYHPSPDYEVSIAAGTYLVRAGAPATWGNHGGRIGSEDYAPLEQLVTLVAGQTTRLDVPLGKGGRIRLTLLLEGQPDPTATGFELLGDDVGAWDDLRRSEGGARVRLEPEGGGDPILPLFSSGSLGLRGLLGPAPEVEWARPGESLLQLNLLPVGAYTVIVEREGFRPARVHIQVTHGEVVPVEVTLVAR